MNFLRLKSAVVDQYRRTYPQYWLDMLVERVRRDARNRRQEVEGLRLRFGQVLAIKRHAWLDLELVIPGLNIVTNNGDLYYAQMSCGESPASTIDYDGSNGGLRLGSGSTSPTKSSNDVTTFLAGTGHALDATYEKTNDSDSDNTGAATDTVTWRYSYTTSEGNVSGINEGAIVDNRTTPNTALTHFLFASTWAKTSSDTAKIFANHNALGV